MNVRKWYNDFMNQTDPFSIFVSLMTLMYSFTALVCLAMLLIYWLVK